ncbi:MAG: prepilin-type N-terminal cleavage/methylation domain-containing protein [Kiritimatiellae bacterium]|nr:prepilin-type N-terminal cleavage/methylation domain-containing protein [Kiritimatiellia bacterium]
MNTKGKKRTHSRGFSLLELLAVISIMAMLTTLAVTSYFNAIRGMTRRSAAKHFANSLILARQRACLEGVRVSVMVFNEITGYDGSDPTVVPSYVVCKEVGKISFISGGSKLIDEFAPLDKMFGTEKASGSYLGSMRLYNLTQGKWWNVKPSVERHNLTGRGSAYKPSESYSIPAYGFVKNTNVRNSNDATWNVGDTYGVESAPPGSLPKGFKFVELDGSSNNEPDNVSNAKCITFLPDGTAQRAETIRIRELLPPNTVAKVSVEDDGSINY